MFEAYRRYFDFQGRARPAEFWLFYAWLMGFGLAMSVISYLSVNAFGSGALNIASAVAFVLVILGSFIPLVTAAVRRMHDTGRAGTWLLLVFVPLGMFAVIVFLALPGQPDANRFGPPPTR